MSGTRVVIGPDDSWPDAISDGLTLPCHYCNVVPAVDYRVTDEAWADVFGDYEARLGVVCIDCFAGLLDVPLASVLIELQVAHGGETMLMRPEVTYQYDALAGADHKGGDG